MPNILVDHDIEVVVCYHRHLDFKHFRVLQHFWAQLVESLYENIYLYNGRIQAGSNIPVGV